MIYTRPMQDLSKLKPTISEEEQAELRKFIEDMIAVGYEWFQEIKGELKGYGKKIMRFFTLPKTELHEQFIQMFFEPRRKITAEKEKNRILWEMKNNKSAFIEEHKISESEWKDVKYKIISRKTLRHPRTWELDEILHIAIPYTYGTKIGNGFAGGILISKLKTPELFEEFLEKIPKFTGTAYLTSNKL